jgi:hypothetical protein
MNDEMDEKLEEYGRMKTMRFPVMKSISFSQEIDIVSGEMQQHLTLVLAKNDSFTGEMCHLDLLNVRNLQIEQPPWSLVNILLIEIVRTPLDSKFEHRLVVLDSEHDGVFTCSCHDFNVYIA